MKTKKIKGRNPDSRPARKALKQAKIDARIAREWANTIWTRGHQDYQVVTRVIRNAIKEARAIKS